QKRGGGRLPRDLALFHAYWLISNRAKAVFQSVDPEGFGFVRCEVWLPDGLVNPPFWLCDVMRVIDAVDEEASQLTIYYDKTDGTKRYRLMGGARVVFKEDLVGSAHVFRMAHMEPSIFCDQEIRDACKAAGLKGLSFEEALKL